MILYLDTSALVKLFVEETHSDRVRKAVSDARLVTTHSIAYVESCAAFARLAAIRDDDVLLAALRKSLDTHWKTWEVLTVTEQLIRRAADLAGRYHLRGYDSLHFAAAESVFEVFRGRTSFCFAVFDGVLKNAAELSGMPSLDA